MASIQLKDRLQAAEDWILANPNPPQKWPWTWFYKTGRSLYALIRDVLSGQLTLHAMSLVYTTLLSIVPLLALSFSVLKALGVHQKMEPFLYQFFQPMGPQGIEMAERILGFVDNIKVGVLGSVGLGLLVYTVISLVQKVERSFNMIWRVPEMRSMAQRFSNYLSVIMVGPLLMVSAIGATATVFSSDMMQTLMAVEPFGSVIVAVSRFTPFFLVVAAFTFVYIFIPNTRVKFRYAFLAGLIAGVSWQAAGMIFASFVAGSAKYAAIYSGFAVGIILLIWIYLNWMILLLGASLSYYMQNPGSVAKRREVQLAPELQERVALALMWMVARPFSRGEPAPQQESLEYQMHVPGEITRNISDKLIRAGLLSLAGRN
ncbi:MAG: YihY/virulence factor BrkB family protein, partial [Marinobacter vinifirmus]